MKRIISILISLALLFSIAASCAETIQIEETDQTTTIEARFATQEEGQELMRGRTLYHEQISEGNLAFLLQKKGGTMEEYIGYAAEQVLSFTPAEEQQIGSALEWLQERLEKHGLKLPDPGVIHFVKTTGREASGAAGYTSEGNIFLTVAAFDRYPDEDFHLVIVHEIFHCLSRLFPEFRQAMYSLIHFTVLEEDIEIPQALREQYVANPDVEHHNATAEFAIDGIKKECYLLFMTEDVFENPGDTFFKHMYTGIVPLGESVLYRVEDVPDFWDVVGRNTSYAEDPEEIMASNFSFALLSLEEGSGSYPNPEILEEIVEYLKAEP